VFVRYFTLTTTTNNTNNRDTCKRDQDQTENRPPPPSNSTTNAAKKEERKTRLEEIDTGEDEYLFLSGLLFFTYVEIMGADRVRVKN
jgi:hypothetical protein